MASLDASDVRSVSLYENSHLRGASDASNEATEQALMKVVPVLVGSTG